MATISISRDILFTEEDIQKIEQSGPTQLYFEAVKDFPTETTKKIEIDERRFSAYLR